ncbi:MAG: hypothetical protein IK092_05050 [Muribaculaceae bacterium]|nr:hypothetical protein [Muribaculaceae bacterium]
MAEEKKGLLDQALGLVSDKAGELLSGDTSDIKKQATEIGKKIAPDQLDDKVEGVVDTALDFLKDTFGKKEEKK